MRLAARPPEAPSAEHPILVVEDDPLIRWSIRCALEDEGLSVEEAAVMLNLSPRTARRLWVFARAWLRRDMERSAGSAF